MAKRPSELRPEWDSLKREAAALQADTTTRGLSPRHPKVQEHEAAIATLNASKDAVAHRAWLTTACDLADVALLAEVVFDYFFDIATFTHLPADIEDRDQLQVAVAYLIRGIFTASQAQAVATEGGKP